MERRNTIQPVAMAEKNLTGYASVFYNPNDPGTQYNLWDRAVERIMPNAFDQALRDNATVALFNHDNNLVLGRQSAGTLRLSVDGKGLKYSITPADTTISRDVFEMVRRGDITGSSFGFVVTDEDWRREKGIQIREVRQVKLIDVSPVTTPAYASTTADLRCDNAMESYKKFVKQRLDSINRRLRLLAINETIGG